MNDRSPYRKGLLILDTVYVIVPLDAVDYILKREAIRTIPAECQAVPRPGNTAMEKAAEVIISMVTGAAVIKFPETSDQACDARYEVELPASDLTKAYGEGRLSRCCGHVGLI